MRYGGQGYELTVACPDGLVGPETLVALRAGFERLHQQVYGYIAAEEPVQVTTLRLEATGVVPKAELRSYEPATGPIASAIMAERQVYLPDSGACTPAPCMTATVLARATPCRVRRSSSRWTAPR